MHFLFEYSSKSKPKSRGNCLCGENYFSWCGCCWVSHASFNKYWYWRSGLYGSKKGRPVLGICIGCQIILDSSDEDGGVPTLGLLHGKAVRFKDEPGLKIPHMGWNQVIYTKEHPIMKGIPDGSDFYYVHSYHPLVANENAFAETTYGSQTFQCIVGKDNLIATQFHLEKSGSIGLQVLKNFSSWNV